MTSRTIDVEEDGQPLTEERIAAFEAKLGRTLPKDFREFLLRHNGCQPSETNNVSRVAKKGGTTIIQCLYGLDTGHDYYEIERTLGTLQLRFEGNFPARRVPIGNDGFGNVFVLSVEDGEYGAIYFLALDAGDKFRLIANSFSDFLDGLRGQDTIDRPTENPQ